MATGIRVDELVVLKRRIADLQVQVEQLREAGQQQFLRLADDCPAMIWTSGPDAECDYVNRAWLHYRGRTAEEETGGGWVEGLHPDDRDLCMETYLRAFHARQPFRMQFRLQRADASYSWVESAGVPRYHANGEFTGFMGTVADVTDRKKGMFIPDAESVRIVFALTERERQVLVLIAQGKSTKEAAARLGISYKTTDSHRSRILEKLGVHETASMVRYAIRAGLVEP
ncbi:MAG: LuxR C-terminal-related transcriptional regulator [Bryobacteraceae bacterium]|jgi:PAS domain S-box-containing protein